MSVAPSIDALDTGTIRSVRYPMWIAARRPLLQLFVIGCAVSLTVSGQLTLRLVAGGMMAWMAIPAFEAIGFAIVRRRGTARGDFASDLDRFYANARPMLCWIVLLGGLVSWLTPAQADVWSNIEVVQFAVLAVTAIVAARTVQRDAAFLRDAFGQSARVARRDAIALRAAVWSVTLAYVFGFAAWPIVADWLHL